MCGVVFTYVTYIYTTQTHTHVTVHRIRSFGINILPFSGKSTIDEFTLGILLLNIVAVVVIGWRTQNAVVIYMKCF